jgi:lipopolysaccharide/colanic/teichoic acid biosynthesis glycosyltransferase
VEIRRLEVRPGITGLAQIQGRNLISWPRRIELDLAYIDQFSIWLDLQILFRTIPVLLRGKGIYGEGGRVAMHRSA